MLHITKEVGDTCEQSRKVRRGTLLGIPLELGDRNRTYDLSTGGCDHDPHIRIHSIDDQSLLEGSEELACSGVFLIGDTISIIENEHQIEYSEVTVIA